MQPEVVTTIAVGVLLALNTTILAWIGKGRFDALHREMVAMKTELKEDVALVRAGLNDVKGDVKQIRSELASIYATLIQVALAVNPQPEAG